MNDREPDTDPNSTGEANSAGDPEALDHEREEYPDPESYPAPEVLSGETPDADLRMDVDDPSGSEERHGRT